jgi:hypothetical protein
LLLTTVACRLLVMTSSADYQLGGSDAEHERPMFPARMLRQRTDRFLRAPDSKQASMQGETK